MENSFITTFCIKNLSVEDKLQYKQFYGELPTQKEITINLPDWFIEYINPKNIYNLSNKKMLIKINEIQNFANTYYFINKLAITYLLKDTTNCQLNELEEKELRKYIEIDIQNQLSIRANLKNNIENYNKQIYEFICKHIIKIEPQKFETYENLLKNIEKEENAILIKHLYWFISDQTSFILLKNIIENNGRIEHFIREYCIYLKNELNSDYFFINYENNWDGTFFENNFCATKIDNAIKNLKGRLKAKSILFSSLDIKGFQRKQNEKYNRKGVAIIVQNLLNYNCDIYFIYKLKIEKLS